MGGVVSWCGREWSLGVGGSGLLVWEGVVTWCGGSGHMVWGEWSRGVGGSGCIGVCIYKKAMLECVAMQHMRSSDILWNVWCGSVGIHVLSMHSPTSWPW